MIPVEVGIGWGRLCSTICTVGDEVANALLSDWRP